MTNLNKLITLLFICVSTMLHAQELDFAVKTKGVEIAGTYNIPPKQNKPPIVIMVAGSGATDRNGNVEGAVSCDAYKMLAEYLASNKIACLRYDKRGIGESIPEDEMKEADMRFETGVDDVKAIIEAVKSAGRFGKIFLLGHSEGALVAMLASQQNADVSGYISLAGPGNNIAQTLKYQLASLDENYKNESYAIIDSLRSGYEVKKVNPVLFSLFRPSVQPYLISWMKYEPSDEIKKVNAPILILQGETDFQVRQEEGERLHQAKPAATYVICKSMSHTLKNANGSTYEEQKQAYTDPSLPLNETLCNSLLAFILQHQ